MNSCRSIIEEFDIAELDMSDDFKQAVRPIVEYVIDTHPSFSAVIRLAALMLESYNEEMKVTEEFAERHPENSVQVYSSPDVFLAFYFLMLATKAENLYNAREETNSGVCASYELSCVGDHETCSMCREKAKNGTLALCSYDTVPPFHVGCRCSMIYKK